MHGAWIYIHLRLFESNKICLSIVSKEIRQIYYYEYLQR